MTIVVVWSAQHHVAILDLITKTQLHCRVDGSRVHLLVFADNAGIARHESRCKCTTAPCMHTKCHPALSAPSSLPVRMQRVDRHEALATAPQDMLAELSMWEAVTVQRQDARDALAVSRAPPGSLQQTVVNPLVTAYILSRYCIYTVAPHPHDPAPYTHDPAPHPHTRYTERFFLTAKIRKTAFKISRAPLDGTVMRTPESSAHSRTHTNIEPHS